MKKFLSVIAILSLVFSPVTPVFAESANWVGAIDATWADTTGNWSNTPGVVPGTGDTATFNAAAGIGGATIDLGAGVTLTSLIFDTAAVDAYTIGTGPLQSLTMDPSGSIAMTAAVANSQTIASEVFINTACGFANNATDNTKLLSFTGPITGDAGGAKPLTLSGSNTGDNLISGIIGNGSGGAVAIIKSGTGKWVLSNANTYTGVTTIGAGSLNIRNNAALGGVVNATTVADGAALEVQGDIDVGLEGLTLNGSGISSGGALRNISGTNSWGGDITLGTA